MVVAHGGLVIAGGDLGLRRPGAAVHRHFEPRALVRLRAQHARLAGVERDLEDLSRFLGHGQRLAEVDRPGADHHADGDARLVIDVDGVAVRRIERQRREAGGGLHRLRGYGQLLARFAPWT